MKSATRAKRLRPLTFVICAAGKGERFKNRGLNTPKPMLRLQGRTMLERSLESLEIQEGDQIIIITYRGHQIQGQGNYEWVAIDHQTRGQLDTFMIVKDLIKHDEVVIYNCDTAFHSDELTGLINSGVYDGIIPCSQEPGTAWSFCKADEQGNISEVAEKNRISDWASVGYYYFRDKGLLFKLSALELSEVNGGEVYVAPVYQRYIQRNLKIRMARVNEFKPFGTLEQVRDYWGLSVEDFIAQNS